MLSVIDHRICWTNQFHHIRISATRIPLLNRGHVSPMASHDDVQVRFANGCFSLPGLLLKYRPLLRILAARHLDKNLGARLSASDIVQQTQLEAFRDIEFFRGNSEQQFVAWLKKILHNNIAQATNTHIVTKKRSIKREQPLTQNESVEPQGGHEEIPSSPHAKIIEGETTLLLEQAMESLTDEQFDALQLRYFEGYSLANIAEHMHRSESAVAGLLKRGLRGLRDVLTDESQP